MDGWMNRQIGRQRGRQVYRYTDRWVGRQRGRQVYR